jgi:hypothetical protein
MPTSVSLATASFNPLGLPNPFARHPDRFLTLLGTLGGTALGQASLNLIANQQQLIQRGGALGPAVDTASLMTIARFRERTATLRDVGRALATTGQTIAAATRPTEGDLLTVRQRVAELVRTYNDTLKLVQNAPLVLKSELADSLKATVAANKNNLEAIGITIATDGTLRLDEEALARALAPSSSTVTTAATTLRDLGRALGTLGQQLSTAPLEKLRYTPPPEPRSEQQAITAARPPTFAFSSAAIVSTYLVMREQFRLFSELGGFGSGTQFSTLV